MRTVSGTVTSSKPICLSKGAKSLRKFVSSPNTRASNAISVFLKRASDSFDELVRFHRHLKKSKRKFKPFPYQSSFMKSQSGDDDLSSWYVDFREEKSFRYSEVSQGGEEEGSGTNKKKRKKRRASESEYSIGGEESEVLRRSLGFDEEEKSNERKKRKKEKVEDVELGDSNELRRKKKKKKRRHGENC